MEEYRSREEVDDWRENRDPIKLFSAWMKERQWLGDDEDEAIQAGAAAEVAKSVAYAEESPLPDPEDVLTDVLDTEWRVSA